MFRYYVTEIGGPGDPAAGRVVFTSKGCAGCHGEEGNRWDKPGPGLQWNHSQGMTAEFRRRRIPRVTFSGQEMADIIAYLYFANYATVRGTPARGKELFLAKCSTCHSIGGGKPVGPDLGAIPRLDDPIAIIAAMWNHAPTMERELRQRGLTWPRFEQGEPADLTAFLLTSRTAAGEARAANK